MYQNIAVLNDGQIVRLYNAVDIHHKIEKATYIGDGRFKVETDKRTFIAKLTEQMTNFVLEGIIITRDEK